MNEAVRQGERADRKNDSNRAVANWLLAGVIMVIVQIALGGITRLTGSGLSITEWEVVTGTLPPLSHDGWLAEFQKYKSTPQFMLLNSDFTLSDFKFIFFWEWAHRLWARLLGLVFAAGFIYFLATRQFKQSMVKPLVLLFLLGGLQGFVGWIMVASGLDGDAVYVKPTRLALHFIFAMGLLCYTYWFYLQLKVTPQGRSSNSSLHRFGIWLLILLVIQLLYGALMAGHKAATAAPTWPAINGSILNPPGLYNDTHGLFNFIDNKIMVHFMHRGLAYLLLILGIWYSWSLSRKAPKNSLLFRSSWLPAKVLTLQVLLGIFTVLTSTGIIPNRWGSFEWMAQLHQLTGMALLLVLVYLLYLTQGGKMALPKAV